MSRKLLLNKLNQLINLLKKLKRKKQRPKLSWTLKPRKKLLTKRFKSIRKRLRSNLRLSKTKKRNHWLLLKRKLLRLTSAERKRSKKLRERLLKLQLKLNKEQKMLKIRNIKQILPKLKKWKKKRKNFKRKSLPRKQ